MTRHSTLKALGTSIAAFALALGLGACSDGDKPADVKEKASDNASDIVDTGEDSEEEQVSDEEATEAAHQLGDLVTVGAWDIKVTKLQLNANPVVKGANEFNEPPQGQYVLVTFEATYNGEERKASAWVDLTWSFTTSDQQVHDQADAVTPSSNEEWPDEARQGGTIKQQVVFDVAPALLPGSILTVEGMDEDFETVYADFPVQS